MEQADKASETVSPRKRQHYFAFWGPPSKNAICCHYFYTLVPARVFKVPKNMLTTPTPNLVTHLQPHRILERATAASIALPWKLSQQGPQQPSEHHPHRLRLSVKNHFSSASSWGLQVLGCCAWGTFWFLWNFSGFSLLQ